MTYQRRGRLLDDGEVATRVAVFGTGKLGKAIIRGSLNLEMIDVVGAIVVDPEKHGRDLGEIAGVGELGVRATTDLDEVLRRDDVDAIIFAGLGDAQRQAELLGRFADAGKDGITVNGLVHPTTALGEEGARALAERAVAGRARIVASGWNPGFALDVLPAVWGSLCTSFTYVHALRIAEASEWGPGILDECRFGFPPEESPPEKPVSMGEPLAVVGDALGITFDHTEDLHEPYVSPNRREFEGRVIEPGTIAGFRKRSVGFRDGDLVVEVEWWGVFCIDPEVDGFTEAVRLKLEGDSTIEVEARGSFFGDPTLVTAAKALNIVTPLRSLPPGVYRPDQVPFSR